MILGLDYHGVIDTNPNLFFRMALNADEVHIITGSQRTDEFINLLLEVGDDRIWWDHIYSLTDDLAEEGHKYTINEFGRKCYDIATWEAAKARYCRKHNIDLHIDDNIEYMRWFSTPFMLYNNGGELQPIYKKIGMMPTYDIGDNDDNK